MKKKSLWTRSLKPLLAGVIMTAMVLGSLLPGVSDSKIAQAAVAGHVVISEIYGGGGNSGSIWKNDFIELYNPTDVAVSLAGWSVQYASASGGFTNNTNLSGSIGSHKYYLIKEAAGSGGTQSLPTPDATGSISMSGTSAKVALANTTATVTGPTGANVIDFVGFGTSANQYEGSGSAPAPSNTASIERKANDGTDPTTVGEGNGNGWDDNNNASNFVVRTSPAPQNSSAAAEPVVSVPVTGVTLNKSTTTIGIGQTDPLVATVQPSNATNKNVAWSTNNTSVATVSTSGVVTAVAAGTAVVIVTTQDGRFTANCTITVTSTPNDNDNIELGNPSGATSDTSNSNNYLMIKPQYDFSYNNSKHEPNWTSWHLYSADIGSTQRQDDFRPDTTLPSGWYEVTASEFSGAGFDRGHMCPSGDRTSSVADNQATFLMDNMIPQAPNNNEVTWEALETYERTLVSSGNELYVISGGYGSGGTGSDGYMTTVGNGVVVPSETWKIIVVLPNGNNDISRITTSTRVISVLIPNDQTCSSQPWGNYRVSVDNIESLTGYNFLSSIPTTIQNAIEASVDNGPTN